MNTQDWLSLLQLTSLDLPAFLSLLGGFTRAVPALQQGPGRVDRAGTSRAWSGTSSRARHPIRVEALDVARGGIDSAVYGYWATLHVRPGGIISVPLAAAG